MNDYFKERIGNYAHLLAVLFSGVETLITEADVGEQTEGQIFSAFDVLLREIMSIKNDAEKFDSIASK